VERRPPVGSLEDRCILEACQSSATPPGDYAIGDPGVSLRSTPGDSLASLQLVQAAMVNNLLSKPDVILHRCFLVWVTPVLRFMSFGLLAVKDTASPSVQAFGARRHVRRRSLRFQAGDWLEIFADNSSAGGPSAATLRNFKQQLVSPLFQGDRRGVLVGDFAPIHVVAVDHLAV
jgi:hypothetical protein